eukprot:gene31464-6649_t
MSTAVQDLSRGSISDLSTVQAPTRYWNGDPCSTHPSHGASAVQQPAVEDPRTLASDSSGWPGQMRDESDSDSKMSHDRQPAHDHDYVKRMIESAALAMRNKMLYREKEKEEEHCASELDRLSVFCQETEKRSKSMMHQVSAGAELMHGRSDAMQCNAGVQSMHQVAVGAESMQSVHPHCPTVNVTSVVNTANRPSAQPSHVGRSCQSHQDMYAPPPPRSHLHVRSADEGELALLELEQEQELYGLGNEVGMGQGTDVSARVCSFRRCISQGGKNQNPRIDPCWLKSDAIATDIPSFNSPFSCTPFSNPTHHAPAAPYQHANTDSGAMQKLPPSIFPPASAGGVRPPGGTHHGRTVSTGGVPFMDSLVLTPPNGLSYPAENQRPASADTYNKPRSSNTLLNFPSKGPASQPAPPSGPHTNPSWPNRCSTSNVDIFASREINQWPGQSSHLRPNAATRRISDPHAWGAPMSSYGLHSSAGCQREEKPMGNYEQHLTSSARGGMYGGRDCRDPF